MVDAQIAAAAASPRRFTRQLRQRNKPRPPPPPGLAARFEDLVCVVAEAKDIYALERTSAYNGRYHVLGGLISPMDGIGPAQLRVKELVERIGANGFEEVIVATNPNAEGEATALYLAKLLRPLGVRVTRIAMGVPVGSDLDYTDEFTMAKAMEGRRDM